MQKLWRFSVIALMRRSGVTEQAMDYKHKVVNKVFAHSRNVDVSVNNVENKPRKNKGTLFKVVFGLDAAWANEKLRWSISLLNDKDTWNLPHNFHNKIIIVEDQIRVLDVAGFWWQAKTLEYHLHRFMKSLRRRAKRGADAASEAERASGTPAGGSP